MKGLIWKSNEFREPQKFRFISDKNRELNLVFIAILGTRRSNFSDASLKNLCAGKNFLWHCKALQGWSRGILVGVDLDIFYIRAIDEGDYYVKFHLCNKDTFFKWALVVVYGPAQTPKDQFLTELVHMVSHERLPTLMGGVFNILMHAHEKNKDNFEGRWPFLFNCVIDGLNLHELEMFGRQFTWVNSLPNPTYEKLDRILISTKWELINMLSIVVALPWVVSDHTPLLIYSEQSSPSNITPMFKFELGSSLRDGFLDMVSEVWRSVSDRNDMMRCWQMKIRRLRQHLRGWVKHTSGVNKKEKKGLLDKLDNLDKKAETSILSPQELDVK
jgi:hypothetical protein